MAGLTLGLFYGHDRGCPGRVIAGYAVLHCYAHELLALGGGDGMMMMTIFFAFEGSSGSSRVTHRTDNGQALDDIVGSFEANEPIIVRVAQSPHLLSSVSSLFIPPTLATQPFAICCSSTSKH